MDSLQMSLRKANLQMKMQLDQRKVLEREELMKGSSVAEQLKKRRYAYGFDSVQTYT